MANQKLLLICKVNYLKAPFSTGLKRRRSLIKIFKQRKTLAAIQLQDIDKIATNNRY